MSRKDVFICHASEDKDRYIKPLTELLRQHGITYWIDEDELRLGDHLHSRISHALNSARYGLVVLSAAFLSKEWANRELQMIREREQAEGQVILLPILEAVSEEVILNKYGFLRNRKFLKWTEQSRLVQDLQHYLQGEDSPGVGLEYSYFLYRMHDLNAIMHWTMRPVPTTQTKQFFGALQRFFHGYSPFIGSVNGSLKSAVDNLCRVLCNCPDLNDDYGDAKLRSSMRYCSRFLLSSNEDHHDNVAELEYQCETALSSNRAMQKQDRAVLTIYLILLRYLQAYSPERGYHALHHEVGSQLYELFSLTLPPVMSTHLPNRYDEYGWDNIYRETENAWLDISGN